MYRYAMARKMDSVVGSVSVDAGGWTDTTWFVEGANSYAEVVEVQFNCSNRTSYQK